MRIVLALAAVLSTAKYHTLQSVDYDARNKTNSGDSETVEEDPFGEEVNKTHVYNQEDLATALNNITDNLLFTTDLTTEELPLNFHTTLEETSSVGLTNTTKNGTSDEEFLKSGTIENSVFNTGIIAGISALVVIIAVLIGTLAFVIYRHFSWNRPQTLSDKFSNDESTGYIDDTAFRENSEEMYSLDNDSFLNSLEAMTIQNYWTDHVKHTKL